MTDFIHHFQPGDANKPVILALHGTGGDENDLIPLVMEAAPGSAIISPRGKILENGMPRFFKRFAEGVFDQEDLEKRTQELADWAVDMADKYGFSTDKLYALGYSNGANIAASILLRRPEVLAGGILLRAMVPFQLDNVPDLSDKKILLLSGIADPIADETQAKGLVNLFTKGHASVKHTPLLTGHGLTSKDVTAARNWLETNA